MEGIRKLIHESIQQFDLKIPDEDKGKFEEIMNKIFIERQKPRDVLGFSEEMMEHLYQYGYRLYDNGNYKKAANVFLGLTVYDPYEARFAMALGASSHRIKNFRDATKYYLRAGMLDPKDPLPFYYMYDCYSQAGSLSDAEICLEVVIRRCGKVPLFAKIKERSLLLLDSLKKEIERLKKEGLVEEIPLNLAEEDMGLPPAFQKALEEQLKKQESALKQELKEESKK